MVSRRERKQRARSKLYLMVALFVAAAVGLLGLYAGASGYAVPAAAMLQVGEPRVQGLLPDWRDVLSSGLPGMSAKQETPGTVRVQPETTAQSVFRNMVRLVTGVDIRDLRSLVQAEIPLLGRFKTGTPTVSAMSLPNFPKFDWRGSAPPGKPLVGIYHTHTSESFVPSSNVAHKPGGQQGDIVEVGDALVKRLAQHGISAVQSKNIHDFPSFMKAYGPSEVTAKRMLADNPSIQMLFDIHRDAGKKEDYTVTVNGVSMAKITLLVAMGQPDLVQPHWEQNHAFAKLIDSRLNQRFPGLSQGIKLDNWRYNQHLHPRALLLEVGCQENTKEEVIRSIELLGDVLSEILMEP